MIELENRVPTLTTIYGPLDAKPRGAVYCPALNIWVRIEPLELEEADHVEPTRTKTTAKRTITGAAELLNPGTLHH